MYVAGQTDPGDIGSWYEMLGMVFVDGGLELLKSLL